MEDDRRVGARDGSVRRCRRLVLLARAGVLITGEAVCIGDLPAPKSLLTTRRRRQQLRRCDGHPSAAQEDRRGEAFDD